MHDIGIDHIAVHSPAQYLPLEALAEARGVDPAKYTIGIGIREVAIPLPSEDVVVLAANAGRKVLEEAGVLPESVGLLVVGTESAEDKSKPTATHVHSLLGINRACRVYDVIHACIGATYGVLQAIDWLAARPGRYALVIASDIARYGRGTLGEPTQGAGAVAMLLSHQPRLMRLEETASYSRDVYDFWKPLDSKYPIVDGMFSTQCFVEAAESCASEQIMNLQTAFLYHTPYPKLVHQAHLRVCRQIDKDTDWKSHFERMVAPGLSFAERIGNIYTGSLWLALASYLEAMHAGTTAAQPSDGAWLFSYGSGCGAATMRGDFSDGWQESAGKLGIGPWLDTRSALSMMQYEQLLDIYEAGPAEEVPDTPQTGWFKFDGVTDSKRHYRTLDRG